jgi:hypothetical protein
MVLAPALVAAAVVTPQLASAAVLHVPFAFSVNGQTLPAGDYTVHPELGGNSVVLASPDYKKQFNWLLSSGDPDPGSSKIAMLFDSTDSGYALRSIQYKSLVTSRIDKKAHLNEDRPVHEIRGE